MSALPFNALRAVEATARLGSYARAAVELSVTPAAVGQHVRGLEARLGAPLFWRGRDGLEPTAATARALPAMRDGFECLRRAVAQIEQRAVTRRVTVSLAPTFAVNWLVPRLPGFGERHPDHEIAFDTTMRLVDIAGGEADLAIRFGSGSYRGLRTDPLFREWVLPVAAPGYRVSGHAIADATDLARARLIHVRGETSDSTWPSWPAWAERFGQPADAFTSGPVFSQSAAARQAAASGQGVALCGLGYALDAILDGRLSAPLGPGSAVATRFSYGLVYAATAADGSAVRAFRRWIEAEALTTAAAIAAFLGGAGQESRPPGG